MGHLKQLRHRPWAALRAGLAFTMAVFTVVVQWAGRDLDEHKHIRLAIAQFSL